MRRHLFPILLAIVALSAACGSGESAAPPQADPERFLLPLDTRGPATSVSRAVTVSSACREAFQQAAAVNEFRDVPEDLNRAATVCQSVADWTAASRLYPDALDGAPPALYLRNRCRSNTGPGSTSLCREALRE